jgi:hypothetical protein
MEPVAPHGPVATQHPVDCLRDADGEALDTPRERGGFIRLDEQVKMIHLHAVVQKPKSVF